MLGSIFLLLFHYFMNYDSPKTQKTKVPNFSSGPTKKPDEWSVNN